MNVGRILTIKRAYDASASTDGYRVLVDRLWPRGLTKARAAIDCWLKDIAPSSELRTWFGHDPAKFDEFTARYNDELAHNPSAQTMRQLLAQHPSLTLVYAAKDTDRNHAIVLQDFLSKNS